MNDKDKPDWETKDLILKFLLANGASLHKVDQVYIDKLGVDPVWTGIPTSMWLNSLTNSLVGVMMENKILKG